MSRNDQTKMGQSVSHVVEGKQSLLSLPSHYGEPSGKPVLIAFILGVGGFSTQYSEKDAIILKF